MAALFIMTKWDLRVGDMVEADVPYNYRIEGIKTKGLLRGFITRIEGDWCFVRPSDKRRSIAVEVFKIRVLKEAPPEIVQRMEKKPFTRRHTKSWSEARFKVDHPHSWRKF
jgi:hypothetical protein